MVRHAPFGLAIDLVLAKGDLYELGLGSGGAGQDADLVLGGKPLQLRKQQPVGSALVQNQVLTLFPLGALLRDRGSWSGAIVVLVLHMMAILVACVLMTVLIHVFIAVGLVLLFLGFALRLSLLTIPGPILGFMTVRVGLSLLWGISALGVSVDVNLEIFISHFVNGSSLDLIEVDWLSCWSEKV